MTKLALSERVARIGIAPNAAATARAQTPAALADSDTLQVARQRGNGALLSLRNVPQTSEIHVDGIDVRAKKTDTHVLLAKVCLADKARGIRAHCRAVSSNA
jgi:hypothetical protein